MKKFHFLRRLLSHHKGLKKMKDEELAIFNVSGNYGNYQIKVGPLDEKTNSRSVEINGKVHHLFINNNHVEPLPSHDEVKNNLRGTVIMNEVSLHLFDKDGEGESVVIEKEDTDGAHARQHINLAGEAGEKMLHECEKTGQLAKETYQIVQNDILKSIVNRK